MTRTNSQQTNLNTILHLIERLSPFAKTVSIAQYRSNGLFPLTIRAAFVKAFEFALFSLRNHNRNAADAFFYIPTLRGITEDLIYLRFIASLPPDDRQQIISGLAALESNDKIGRQKEFFRVFRPFQPVLYKSNLDNEKTEQIIRNIWQKNGWPSLRAVNPPTREIANKIDAGALLFLYDFLFRLTSSTVHFNPSSLLRLGWGQKRKVLFSTKNMNPYFSQFAQVYGALLICLHFEFFPEWLKPTKSVTKTVRTLRGQLVMQNRWPEMVTFEEMNIQVPTGLPVAIGMFQALYATIYEDGFIRQPGDISPYEKWLNPRSERGPLSVAATFLGLSDEGAEELFFGKSVKNKHGD